VNNATCPDCAATSTTTGPVERTTANGGHYLYVGKRTVGNGIAKPEKLRPKIDEIIKTCNKFGELVPATLRSRVKAVCTAIDPTCAKEFPW
jgi:hypothetical protein